MTICLPASFVDVSTMREIPDTQECWTDAGVLSCGRCPNLYQNCIVYTAQSRASVTAQLSTAAQCIHDGKSHNLRA